MEPIRRSALVEATIIEIGRIGTLDITVAQIAKRAGMSSALAHHYFGGKEQMFAAAMRHVMTLYGAEVRGALAMAHSPRDRVEAIIRASFSATNFRPEVVAAWMNFYVQAQRSAEAERLLRVYHARLHSNLYHDLRKLTGAGALQLTRGIAAMIDGLYIRQALGGDVLAAEDAIDLLLDYLDTHVPPVEDP
ncbi:transcriptional regulator BetI [Rhodophyticola sp. CCM32]|uniref:choline-binding transcriptional repressor BetI n=1 Tax=Rhodophyticola sp. CCM32 TaxID=2916397 RepID=UPI00107EF2A1|nr:transcriptional regulator BetI [Rhodophyticola sp. CCM32]QBY02567.1 transcriptional regulator BetI [Rhodophyticola sp. CCM32]